MTTETSQTTAGIGQSPTIADGGGEGNDRTMVRVTGTTGMRSAVFWYVHRTLGVGVWPEITVVVADRMDDRSIAGDRLYRTKEIWKVGRPDNATSPRRGAIEMLWYDRGTMMIEMVGYLESQTTTTDTTPLGVDEHETDVNKRQRQSETRWIRGSTVASTSTGPNVRPSVVGWEPLGGTHSPSQSRMFLDRLSVDRLIQTAERLAGQLMDTTGRGKTKERYPRSAREWATETCRRGTDPLETDWFETSSAMALAASIYDRSSRDLHSLAVRLVAVYSSARASISDPETLVDTIVEDPTTRTFHVPRLGKCAEVYRCIWSSKKKKRSVSTFAGVEIEPHRPLYSTITQTVLASDLRNDVSGGDRIEYVLDLPANPTVALRMLGRCSVCDKKKKTPNNFTRWCSHKRPFACDGRTWATAADVAEIAWIASGLAFDAAVDRMGLEMGAEGLCETAFLSDEEIMDKVRASESARASTTTTSGRDARTYRLYNEATKARNHASAELHRRLGFGVEEVSDYLSTATTPHLDEIMDGSGWRTTWLCSSSGTAAIQTRGLETPLRGYEALSMADWDAGCLRDALPPCLRKIVEECTTVRHPKYPERVVLGSLLSGIDGLDRDELYRAWKSLFRHPESTAVVSSDDPRFDGSKYGKSAVLDAVKFRRRGMVTGCPFCVKNGLCPFSSSASGSGQACATDLYATCNVAVGRIGSPWFYYRVAYDRNIASKPDNAVATSRLAGEGDGGGGEGEKNKNS